MSLHARIGMLNGRPVLFINDTPTTEFWCYGDPDAMGDFAAGRMRICQFHVPFPSWWTGPGLYDFAPTARMIRAFLDRLPSVLLLPRVNFGYEGERWWGQLHPGELAIGCDLDGKPIDYLHIRARPVECWYSSCSRQWVSDATAAMRAFVGFCEESFGNHILGYQIGGGISAEWFRWWNFVEDVYEDYSDVARRVFQEFLRDRYGDDRSLRTAWRRDDVALDTAEVPLPRRLHTTTTGYFRAPQAERDVVDWLECLSHHNAGQLLSLAESAKDACRHRKIVGTFFGYLWPHWNTQSPARAGHLGLDRLLASPDVDFISSPYHYDNRHVGGFHHSQTVPATIERAGKLHLDEIDTFTHRVVPEKSRDTPWGVPRDARESCRLLRRDAASVLGTAGTGWWMDLHADRWYDDLEIQAELRRLQRLAIQSLAWNGQTHAEVALVIDDRSYLWADLRSPLNQCFTSMPRQLAWSDLGFPIDTLTLREVPGARPYRLYLFLNAWYVDATLRRDLIDKLRQPGVTAIWFHGCGCISGDACSAENAAELAGMNLRWIESGPLEIEGWPGGILGTSDASGKLRFGARLNRDQAERLIAGPGHDWSPVSSPRLAVADPRAVSHGTYIDNREVGFAVLEREGWKSVFCGAPLLPGELLTVLAEHAGIHRYTTERAQVFHRGPLIAVYAPLGGKVPVRAPVGHGIRPLVFSAAEDRWRPDPRAECRNERTVLFEAGETHFFLCALQGESGDGSIPRAG